ncbi:MAG TPA: type I-E CRISPR-associated protein Cse1/CasA, partial [Polyangiaceae bacterium]
ERFDMAALGAYLAKWSSHFDLFHPETPFYQVPRLVEQSTNYQRGKKPAREMIAEQSSYGAPRELFESRPDEFAPISAAAAARWLVSMQAFHTGGLLTRDAGNGDPTSVQAAPLCGVAVVTVFGRNLFETLMLNLLPYPDAGIFATSADDSPAWEKPASERYRKRAPKGWLDWLTWQSRRIQLFGDAEKGVESFLLLSGNDLSSSEAPRDAMCAYRETEKFGYLPIRFSEEKALWRDSVALVQCQDEDTAHGLRSARVVAALARRSVEAGQDLKLHVYGQIPNKASIVLTRREVVPIPTQLIDSPELVGTIREVIQLAEEIQQALRESLFLAAQRVLGLGDRNPDKKDIRQLLDGTQAVQRFWAALKPAFDRFLMTLPTDSNEAAMQFRLAARKEAVNSFSQAARQLGNEGRTLKGFALGQSHLNRELARLNPRCAVTSQATPSN